MPAQDQAPSARRVRVGVTYSITDPPGPTGRRRRRAGRAGRCRGTATGPACLPGRGWSSRTGDARAGEFPAPERDARWGRSGWIRRPGRSASRVGRGVGDEVPAPGPHDQVMRFDPDAAGEVGVVGCGRRPSGVQVVEAQQVAVADGVADRPQGLASDGRRGELPRCGWRSGASRRPRRAGARA